jgi:hypothetical protein
MTDLTFGVVQTSIIITDAREIVLYSFHLIFWLRKIVAGGTAVSTGIRDLPGRLLYLKPAPDVYTLPSLNVSYAAVSGNLVVAPTLVT